MRSYEFRYTTDGGPGDGYEGPIRVDMTDEQGERLEAYVRSGVSDELTRVDPVKDIYDSVRGNIASLEMRGCDWDYIREFGEEDEDGDVDLDAAMENYLDVMNLTIYLPGLPG